VIVAWTAEEVVDAGAAVQQVVTRVAGELVVPLEADHEIVAGAAIQRVIAVIALECVGSGPPEKMIVA
jgi:hypothetical protein